MANEPDAGMFTKGAGAGEGGSGRSDEGKGNEAKKTAYASGAPGFAGVLNFSTFIISLTTSMLVNLGELPDPISNTKSVNLPLAKQTISIIEMLRDKTRGNLTADEERLIDHVLYDLRMKYVNLTGKGV